MRLEKTWGRLDMKYRLSDLCEYRKEKVPVSDVKIENYISTENMLPNKEGITIAASIPNTGKVSRYKKGDILVSNIRPYFQKIWLADREGACSNDILIINANCNISNEYLYYSLTSNEFFLYMMSTSKGTKMPRGDKEAIMQFELDILSREKQEKAITLLSLLDKKIHANRMINNNLENQLHLYYRMLFKENPKDNWRLGTLEDLGKIIGGGTPSKKVSQYYSCDGIPWITPKDLSKNQSKFIARGATDISEEGLNNSSAVLMPKGSVLFSSRAPIGYIAIAKNKLSTNQGFKSVIPYENFGTTLVYCFLKDNLQIIDSLSSGSTFNEVSTKTMKNIPALIPDIETVSEFRNYADKVLKLQEQFEEQIFKLNTVKEFLLIKLLSGELDVSNIDF